MTQDYYSESRKNSYRSIKLTQSQKNIKMAKDTNNYRLRYPHG